MKRCLHCRASIDGLPTDYQVVRWAPAFLVVKPSEIDEGLFVVVDVFDTERDAQTYIRSVLRKHETSAR